jgi:hypothetical protein
MIAVKGYQSNKTMNEETIMWASVRKNASLRNLARTSTNSRLFADVGLDREDFVNSVDDQMRKRFWWYR